MTTTSSFSILVELDGDGAHPASWRAAAHPPTELLTGRRIADVVRAAERAGFTAATFADSPLPSGTAPDVTGRIDAIQRAAFAAPLTSALGLIATGQALSSEPFHVSTQLSALDTASAGRAGWLVAAPEPDAGRAGASAAVYGREALLDADAIDREYADVVEVSRRLWDSWEDDAVIRDVPTGRYIDRERVHAVAFEGERFSVVGPSISPRPPQGQLVVLADARIARAAEVDVALVVPGDVAGTVTDASGLSALLPGLVAAAAAARADGTARVVLELEVVLDSRGVTAARRLAALDAHTVWPGDARPRFVGTAEALVAVLTELATVVDGVRLHPAVVDTDVDEVGRAVLPALRAAGVFVSPRVGATLRETLGLPEAANRFASARQESLA